MRSAWRRSDASSTWWRHEAASHSRTRRARRSTSRPGRTESSPRRTCGSVFASQPTPWRSEALPIASTAIPAERGRDFPRCCFASLRSRSNGVVDVRSSPPRHPRPKGSWNGAPQPFARRPRAGWTSHLCATRWRGRRRSRLPRHVYAPARLRRWCWHERCSPGGMAWLRQEWLCAHCAPPIRPASRTWSAEPMEQRSRARHPSCSSDARARTLSRNPWPGLSRAGRATPRMSASRAPSPRATRTPTSTVSSRSSSLTPSARFRQLSAREVRKSPGSRTSSTSRRA